MLTQTRTQNNSPKSALVLQVLTGLAAGYPDFSKSFYALATPLMLGLIKANKAGVTNGANINYFDANRTYFTTGAETLSVPVWQVSYPTFDEVESCNPNVS